MYRTVRTHTAGSWKPETLISDIQFFRPEFFFTIRKGGKEQGGEYGYSVYGALGVTPEGIEQDVMGPTPGKVLWVRGGIRLDIALGMGPGLGTTTARLVGPAAGSCATPW